MDNFTIQIVDEFIPVQIVTPTYNVSINEETFLVGNFNETCTIDLVEECFPIVEIFQVGEQGIPGVNGSVWYNGTSAPNNSLGENNDYYLNTVTGDIYEKVLGTWGIPIGNIRGPEGPAGSPTTPGGYIL